MTHVLRPVGPGEEYPILDDIPDGFIERVSAGFICGTCRAAVPRRDDTAQHSAWHAELAQR